MNRFFKTFGLFLAIAFLFACNSTTTETKQTESTMPGMHKGVIEEVLHTNVYTYLHLNEDNNMVWIAIPKREINKGLTIYYMEGLEMPNFKSKELDRTFDKVSLIEEISETPFQENAPSIMQKPAGKLAPSREEVADIKHTENETSIAQIFADPSSYANKTVTVRGTVVKVNDQIMGKNWIHIQDGTEYKGLFDLTVTTNEPIKLGSVVGFKGTIFLNKDFGAGYVYDVIMEEATVESATEL